MADDKPGKMKPKQIQNLAKSVMSDRDDQDCDDMDGQCGPVPVPAGHAIDRISFEKADSGGVISRTSFKRKPGYQPKKSADGDGPSEPSYHNDHTAIHASHEDAANHLKSLFGGSGGDTNQVS